MKRIIALALAAVAGPLAAQPTVEIDANTRIRYDPKLLKVTGTDLAAAGSMRREEDLKSGAAGEAEKKPLVIRPRPEKDKARK